MFRGAILAGILATLASSPAARADPPVRERETSTERFVDSELCGFPLQFDLTEIETYTTFPNGDVRRLSHADGTISANGVTLIIRDRYVVWIRADRPSVRTITGRFTTVARPNGGIVVREAGRIVYDRATGEILSESGPHGFNFHGETEAFCAAFAAS